MKRILFLALLLPLSLAAQTVDVDLRHPMVPVRTSLSGAPLTAGQNTFPLVISPYSFEIYVFSVL